MVDHVVGMPSAFVAEDGSRIVLEFGCKSGVKRKLQFEPSQFDRFMNRAAELVARARSQTLATSGHLEIHAVGVADVQVLAPAGGGKVILSMIGSNGYPLHYAVTPEVAERMRQELATAIESSKTQSSAPRH